MNHIFRTDSEHKDFHKLVKELDADLKIRDGEDHAFYAQYNKVDTINHVVLASINNNVVGCGAIKQFDEVIMEIKRMYVQPEFRGKGLASGILHELEIWAGELGYNKCILETGINQHEAIGLYKKKNYVIIPNYGQYADVKTSFCFEKLI